MPPIKNELEIRNTVSKNKEITVNLIKKQTDEKEIQTFKKTPLTTNEITNEKMISKYKPILPKVQNEVQPENMPGFTYFKNLLAMAALQNASANPFFFSYSNDSSCIETNSKLDSNLVNNQELNIQSTHLNQNIERNSVKNILDYNQMETYPIDSFENSKVIKRTRSNRCNNLNTAKKKSKISNSLFANRSFNKSVENSFSSSCLSSPSSKRESDSLSSNSDSNDSLYSNKPIENFSNINTNNDVSYYSMQNICANSNRGVSFAIKNQNVKENTTHLEASMFRFLEKKIDRKQLLQINPYEWSVDDVFEFVKSLTDLKTARLFKSQEIDGSALSLINEYHLINSMQMKLGPALKIINQFGLLNKNYKI